MKCPHCKIEIHSAFTQSWIENGNAIGYEDRASTSWNVQSMVCPSCNQAILHLNKIKSNQHRPITSLIYPKSHARLSAPKEVPDDLREDFNEAIAVLEDSPKASAALSRRCLQSLLRAQGYQQHDLVKAIEAVLASKSLPSSLASNVDAVRNIGNFAAHPIKDTNSGEIVPVEPHEAEWNLDVLEGLFDFYYVQPAKDKARIEALNAKLATVGKPQIKQ